MHFFSMEGRAKQIFLEKQTQDALNCKNIKQRGEAWKINMKYTEFRDNSDPYCLFGLLKKQMVHPRH